MTHGYLDVVQLALLVLVAAKPYGPDVRRAVRRLKRWRARRGKLHTEAARNCGTDDVIDVAAQLVADETKRRLWLIRSGSDDAA